MKLAESRVRDGARDAVKRERVKATDGIKICIWFQPPHANKTPTFAETAVDVSHKMHIALQGLSGDNGCDFPIQLEAIKENVQADVSFLCLFWLQLKTGLMLIYLKKLARVKRYFAKVFTSFPVHILPHGISEPAFKLKLTFLSFRFLQTSSRSIRLEESVIQLSLVTDF